MRQLQTRLLGLAKISRRLFCRSWLGTCAVLIDGDNVPPRLAGALVDFASSLGRIQTIEVFANFASAANSGWAAHMRLHGITGIQHYRTAAGKNATDATLIVRAMDLLHTSKIDHFVLVSSDSDFSALAHRIRRSGAKVHGLGSDGSSPTLRESCTTFHTFANLRGTAIAGTSPALPDLWSAQPGDVADRLLGTIVSLGGARGWVSVADLGRELSRTVPKFDSRAYSRRTLTDLCASISGIQVDRSVAPPRVRVDLETRTG